MAPKSGTSSLLKAQPRDLLTKILTEPSLVRAVRSLPAPALAQLVRRVGLEDSGELLALASTSQLLGVFDEDLWKQQEAGDDETFDAERFSVWLEILLEGGEDALADRLVQLPEDFLIMGLQGQVMVLDMDTVISEISAMDRVDADQTEKALDSCLCEEIENFRIISRRHEGWDAVLSALLALDKNHHQVLDRILEKLANASEGIIEEQGGLCEALTTAEMIASDAQADREDRRGEQGYVAPASARSFLALCRQTAWEDVLTEDRSDPVTRAYFRELVVPKSVPEREDSSELLEMLRKAGGDTDKKHRVLNSPEQKSRDATFRKAMKELGEKSPDLQRRRTEELVFLMNVLMTGAPKKYRSTDAALAVSSVCNLGLERSGQSLETTSADKLFRIGYKVLHDEVTMPAAQIVYEAARRSNSKKSSQLKKWMDAQEPWRLREYVGVLNLEPSEQKRLEALIDSLPSGVSSTAELELIGTEVQLRKAKKFIKSVSGIVSESS